MAAARRLPGSGAEESGTTGHHGMVVNVGMGVEWGAVQRGNERSGHCVIEMAGPGKAAMVGQLRATQVNAVTGSWPMGPEAGTYERRLRRNVAQLHHAGRAVVRAKATL